MYAFVQALIREVAYGTLAKRDRRARHLAAARFFEGLGEDELAGPLAVHYLAAWRAAPGRTRGRCRGDPGATRADRSGRPSDELGSPEGAIGFLEQALQVTADPSDRGPILERAGKAATNAVRPDRADAFFRELIESRRAAGDSAGTFRAIAQLGSALIAARRLESAGTLLEPAVKEAEGAADEADLAALLCGLARVRFSQDRVEEGLDLIDRGLPIAERNELHELLIEGLITKGNLLAKHGRPVEGNALTEGARRVAVERGFPEWEARALIAMSLRISLGDPRAALQLEREAIDLVRRIGRRDMELLLIGNAGEDSIRTGDWEFQATEFASLDELEIEPAIRLPMESTLSVIAIMRGEVDGDAIDIAYVEDPAAEDHDTASTLT